MESKAIEKRSEFAPTTYKELREFVDIIAESDMVPKSHCTKDGKPKKANLMACIIMGESLGVHPMQAIQNICVINGMPSVWGDLALALVKKHPDCVDIIEERIENGWRCTSKRKGKKDVVREFTLDDAKKAKLTSKDGVWQYYPDRMLQMRARGFSIRDQFPDALRGLKIAEEIIDVQAEVTPEESPADRLRRAKAEKENGQQTTVEEKPKDTDADAIAVLELLTSQLREIGYEFSDKEIKRIGELETDEEVTKAIKHYEKKLIAIRQTINVDGNPQQMELDNE